jgi:hypothetical protein
MANNASSYHNFMSLTSIARLIKSLKTAPRRALALIERFLFGLAAFDSEMRISKVRAVYIAVRDAGEKMKINHEETKDTKIHSFLSS